MLQAQEHRRLDTIRDRVRAGGRRWTIAKCAVVEALLSGAGHLSAQQVHEQIIARYPQIDRSTVHRVLLALANDRVVHALDQRGEARYGLVDPEHHHAVCIVCGREAEVRAATVRQLLASAGSETGFDFNSDSITLTGRCDRCRPGA